MKKLFILFFVLVIGIGVSASEQNFFAYKLILDIDGNGVDTINIKDKDIYFDSDNDGFREKTSWISKKDALLVIDKDGDGKIKNQSEVFGKIDMSGFEDLRQVDSNSDGIIDVKDIDFPKMFLWQDLDENGVVGNGELKSLSDAGISSINLNYSPLNDEKNGNSIVGKALVKFSDGTSKNLYDVKLPYVITNTVYGGDYILDADVIDLPWLRGYGRTLDLQLASSQEDYLKNMVIHFSKIYNADELYDKFDLLISRWIGDNQFGTKLYKTVITKVMREALEDDINNFKPDNIKKAYTFFKNRLFLHFCAQTSIGKIFPVKFDYREDKLIYGPNIYNRIIENMTDSSDFIVSFLLLERMVLDKEYDPKLLGEAIKSHGYGAHLYSYVNSGESFKFGKQKKSDDKKPVYVVGTRYSDKTTGNDNPDIIYGSDGDDYIDGQGGDDWLSGGRGNDKIYGNDGNDILIGNEGVNYLYGGGGNDIYIYYGAGSDVIIDEKWATAKVQEWYWDEKISDYRDKWVDKGKVLIDGGVDKVIFANDSSPKYFLIQRYDNDLVFKLKNSKNTLTLKNWYSSPEQRIEEFVFADGSQLDIAKLMKLEKHENNILDFISMYFNSFVNSINDLINKLS